MEEDLSTTVRASQLSILRYRNGEITHSIYDPGDHPSTPPREETWTTTSLVGKGGQGQVFLQTCTAGSRLHKLRAVKRISVAQRPGDKKRYMRELRAITLFSHARYSRHFVQSLGWYERKGSLYITMEYLEDGDLHTYLQSIDRPMTELECRHIIRQILQSLDVMHTEDFTHGDIKPKNVLIRQRAAYGQPQMWWVKLADFGISKRAKEISGDTTLAGTLEFMAPELLHGKPPEDPRAGDIWAVGAMAFHILTKQAAFKSPILAVQYADSPDKLFPRAALSEWDVTADGQGFIRRVLEPIPERRLVAKQALDEGWVQIGTTEIQQTETDYDSESSNTSSAASSASARSDERGLTTQLSSTADSTAMWPLRDEYTPIWWGTNSPVQRHRVSMSARAKSTDKPATHLIEGEWLPAATEARNAIPRQSGISSWIDERFRKYIFGKKEIYVNEESQENAFKQYMRDVIKVYQLDHFFPEDDPFLHAIINRAVALERVPGNMLDAKDLAHLALYRLVFYCDDSDFLAEGDRQENLRLLVQRITRIATRVLPDNEGIELRFINNPTTAEMSQPSLAQIDTIMTQMPAPGWNGIVADLDSKVLHDIVYTPLAQDALERPVLVVIITAGKLVPLMNSLKQAVKDCGEQLKAKGFAPKVVRFQVSQIGNDPDAKQYLKHFDKLVQWAGLAKVLHVTSEPLDAKFKKFRSNDARLEQWLLKILMRSITDAEAE